MWKYSLLFVLLLLQFVTSGLVRRCSTSGFADPDQQLRVSIIVSSVPKDEVARRLILSWENASPVNGDWIGLFNEEPSSSSVPLFVVQPQSSSGWVETNTHETASPSHDLGFSKKCLGFWVAYISADSSAVVASSCLQTEPTWMSDLETELSPLLLRQIFLPGTHDTGAYEEYDPSSENNLIIKYTITQEEDILSQLIHGVRYLDIRAAYYTDRDGVWWVNHGLIPVHPLQSVFDDVRTFLQNTNEIVILDFHEFPVGFGSGLDIHEKLLQLLESEFGDIAAPSSLTWNAQLGDIWSTNRRLLLTYNNGAMVEKSDILWPAVSHQWGNVQTLDNLYTYLSVVMNNPPDSKGWSAMAELTPTTLQVITDELGGLRRMADLVNQNVTTWYRGIWGQTVNIVAADFFRGTGLVEAAIDWNRIRAQQLACSINSDKSLHVNTM